MPVYTWDVMVPGEDLPERITTDYILSEGEEINAGGRAWIVERVEIEESIEPATGVVSVAPLQEPATVPPLSSVPPPPK